MSKRLSLYVLVSLLCLVFRLPVTVKAQTTTQFQTDITAYYTIKPDNSTQVRQVISLRNQLSSSFVSKYAFEVGSTAITDIAVVLADDEPINFDVNKTSNSTIVSVDFEKNVVGKDRILEFSIEYVHPDISQYYGKVLEISIPKLDLVDSVNSYTTVVSVPDRFGNVASQIPLSDSFTTENGVKSYFYSDKEKQRKGISLVFGDSQVLDFTLNYHLENPTVNKGVTQITIPPDTQRQKMFYSTISPAPKSITADNDGNWLATYVLQPKETIDVVVQGSVKLYLKPEISIPRYTEDINQYLLPQPYWESSSPTIVELAEKLKTPEAIYHYVVDNFTYNYDRLDGTSGRMGAEQALSNPNDTLCQEFTDTFIALARAAGIPAREHNGYAYTRNSGLRPLSLVQDVLHAWPEYFDVESQTWIAVDPTWGNTTGGRDYFHTLDSNHFTFVIHGMHSDRPYAAGYYRDAGSVSKDILVSFSLEEPQDEIDFDYELKPNFLTLTGLPFSSQLITTNNTGLAYYNLSLELDGAWIRRDDKKNVPLVLPYSSVQTKVQLQAPKPYFTQPDTVDVTVKEKTKSVPVSISRTQEALFWASIVGVGISGFLIAFITWRLLVSRRK